jgi:hypothetical protein
MSIQLLEAKFARIGARLAQATNDRRFRETERPVRLDIRSDDEGECFVIHNLPAGGDGVEVLDVQPRDRHLLLMVRDGQEKSKFLCGHDERHWFVAAVPESAPVGTVLAAKEALKPAEVRQAEARHRVGSEARNKRKNAAFRRQGEWFFVPAPELVVDPKLVLRNEPIRRGAGKPHTVEFCYRTGGETVWVCRRHPNGVSPQRYAAILASNAKAASWDWRPMQRNPGVYVKGRVRHADHRTITLNGWHRVLMNTETQARAMRNVAFLD